LCQAVEYRWANGQNRLPAMANCVRRLVVVISGQVANRFPFVAEATLQHGGR